MQKFFYFGGGGGICPDFSPESFLGCHVKLAGNLPASQWSLSLIIVVITELYRNIITEKTNTILPQGILLHASC